MKSKKTIKVQESSLLLRLDEIGNNVASLWGAECLSWEIDQDNQKVLFHCIEHGERFATELEYIDLHKYIN